MLLATASAVAASGGLVDLAEAQSAPPPGASTFSWTGFYAGLNVGATRHSATTLDVNGWGTGGLLPSLYVTPFFQSQKTSLGFGGQVGYNWQYNNYVIGAEADIGYAGVRTSFTPPNTLFFNCGTSCFTSASNELSWLATFRGRAGMLVSDKVLIYGTGGLALGAFENRWSYGTLPPNFNSPFNDSLFSSSEVRAGFVWGGGVEFAALPNATVRFEVLQADFGTSTSNSVTGIPYLGNGGTFVSAFTNKITTGRASLNWRW
ncbi:MAG: outer membrane protein [Xanthobacteraceae bacterium]